ncbi:hypothetical protein HanRHA438_Chr13g0604801 [Helianthus annuus]|nr:hypothetical protein HanRHA438_Chr13g0604801 [Helianthus annuus]
MTELFCYESSISSGKYFYFPLYGLRIWYYNNTTWSGMKSFNRIVINKLHNPF